MTARDRPVNLAASVRQRLLNLARDRGEEFQLVLSDYAVERMLYRLSVSRHAERFVLKGAQLMRLWTAERYRATWDLDLLGLGESSVESVEDVLRELCSVRGDDGVIFLPETVIGQEIRAADEYSGVRVRLTADLAGAKIPVQVDVGFGDVVVPPARRETYPTLLDQPAPELLTYPREAVIGEKLEAMVTLGVTNSRMRDFYDVHSLAASFDFDGSTLVTAIASTFERRKTPIPTAVPMALLESFLAAPERSAQWRAFVRRSRIESAPAGPRELGALLREFLMPPLEAVRSRGQFDFVWVPGGPWARRGLHERRSQIR